MKEELIKILKREGYVPFSNMSYEDYEPYQSNNECFDLTYVMMVLYDDLYPYMIKKIGNVLSIVCVMDSTEEILGVLLPKKGYDEELPRVIDEMAELMKRTGIKMRIGTMCSRHLEYIKEHPLLHACSYDDTRSDYLYEIAQYLNTEGGSNSHKRRDLNKVKKEYPDIRVEEIQDFKAQSDVIMDIMDKWCEGYDCSQCKYGCEAKVIRKLLESDLTDKLYGAIMYLNNEPVMFAISEIIGDTCYLYFKKSSDKIHGTFYYFEYEFLKKIEHIKYVNFAEDLGLPGLREYKQRRHPVRMIHKYDIYLREKD